MANAADQFFSALESLNAEWDLRGVNTPTRVNAMVSMALVQVDVYKIANVSGNQALTEDEFLKLCRRVYWETRKQIQANPNG